MPEWHVYLVRCTDGSLYTGIATNVERRLAEHIEGKKKGARYLRGRGPLELVFTKPVGTRCVALRIESLIKRLPKVEKERLVDKSQRIEPLLALARRRLRRARESSPRIDKARGAER